MNKKHSPDNKRSTDNEETEWNTRKEGKPILQWIFLLIILAVVAYVASGL